LSSRKVIFSPYLGGYLGEVRLPLFILFAFTCLSAWAQTICIDPGHPSEVGPGTKGKLITEMRAAWLVALDLKSELQAAGYRVVMVKTSEKQFLTNKNRAGIANEAKADLLIRLHCDHAPGGRGFATFFADKQGRDGKKVGPPTAVIAKLKTFGPKFHRAVIASLNGLLPDRGYHSDRATKVGGQYGALKGSIYSEVPSILVEMAVLNSSKDEAVMASDSGRKAVAKAIRRGIEAIIPVQAK